MGGVELKPSGRVEAIERVEDGWRVEGKEFEAVVVASHGPSLAATAVAAAAAETADPAVVARLTGLVEAIARVRESRCAVVSAVVEVEGGEAIPFDAVTTPSSSVLQFLAREASKPGRADAGNAWTVVSTSSFADKRPGNDAVASLGLLLADEALRLLCPHGAKLTSASGQKCGARPSPRRRWRAGRAAPSTRWSSSPTGWPSAATSSARRRAPSRPRRCRGSRRGTAWRRCSSGRATPLFCGGRPEAAALVSRVGPQLGAAAAPRGVPSSSSRAEVVERLACCNSPIDVPGSRTSTACALPSTRRAIRFVSSSVVTASRSSPATPARCRSTSVRFLVRVIVRRSSHPARRAPRRSAQLRVLDRHVALGSFRSGSSDTTAFPCAQGAPPRDGRRWLYAAGVLGYQKSTRPMRLCARRGARQHSRRSNRRPVVRRKPKLLAIAGRRGHRLACRTTNHRRRNSVGT